MMFVLIVAPVGSSARSLIIRTSQIFEDSSQIWVFVENFLQPIASDCDFRHVDYE